MDWREELLVVIGRLKREVHPWLESVREGYRDTSRDDNCPQPTKDKAKALLARSGEVRKSWEQTINDVASIAPPEVAAALYEAALEIDKPSVIPTLCKIAGMHNSGADAFTYLDGNDTTILRHLASIHPRIENTYEIEAALNEGNEPISRKTIGDRLKAMPQYVCQPKGERGGWGLTPDGLKIIASL